jgi:hypothetical protein
LAAGADHACMVGGSSGTAVDWAALCNPILSYPAAGVKDEAIVRAGRNQAVWIE